MEFPRILLREYLKEFVTRRGLLPGITLGSCTVLETAGDGAREDLYNVMGCGISESEPLLDSSSNGRMIWVHFGVNGGSLRFQIERQAVNEASFRCPDELGWQPQQLPIVPEDGGTSQTRQTCSIDAIARFLQKKGYDVGVSEDAGRFVCNYVYYHSLRHAKQKGHKSIFVHVPLFSNTDEDTQMQFTASLLQPHTDIVFLLIMSSAFPAVMYMCCVYYG